MPIDNTNSITEGGLRNFYQVGSPEGAMPTNETLFAGLNGQHFIITDATRPRRGSITPQRVPDPLRRKKFKTVNKSEEPADDPTITVQFTRKHGSIPRQLYDLGQCPVTFYQSAGACKDPSDFNNGWTDYLLAYTNGLAGDAPIGGQQGWDSDELVVDSIDFTLDSIYAIGALTADIDVEQTSRSVIAVTYGIPDNCTACSLGTETIYAIAVSTVNQQPYLYWTTDGGATWTNGTIAPWTDEVVNDIAVASNVLIISYDGGTYGGDGGYYLIALDPVNGTPNTGGAIQVETGWGSSRFPQAVFALSATEVFFPSQGGYIYKSRQLSAGVAAVESGGNTTATLSRIHGIGEVLVAVGAGNAVLYSLDSGRTWAEPAAFPAIGDLRGVHVINRYVWWVCGDDKSGDADTGFLSYTVDGGRNWTRIAPAGRAGISFAYDVRFATPECGYFLAATAGSPSGDLELYTTCDGGFTWVSQGSRFTNDFVATLAYRIAVPENATPEIAANNAVMVGNKTGSPNPGRIYRLGPNVF